MAVKSDAGRLHDNDNMINVFPDYIMLHTFILYIGAGSRHGQGWAEPTQMCVLPSQSELDKDCIQKPI